HLQDIGARADERDPRLLARTGEVRVLRQEAVAGVHGISAGFLGHPHDLGDVEIRTDRVPLLPDLIRLVCLQSVFGIAVLVGEHGHGLRAQLVGCAESTHGDLATVGDKHLVEHSNSILPAPVHDASCGTRPLYKRDPAHMRVGRESIAPDAAVASAPLATLNRMRILHTSDWHLGRRLHGVDLTDAQRKFLDWLHTVVEERGIDVVAIAGDVYDRAIPHPDALGLWEYAVSGLLDRGARIVASSGNHDSFVRLGLNRHHLDRAGVHLRTHLSDIVRGVRIAPDGEVLRDTDPRAGVSLHGIPYLEPSLVWERMGASERTHAAVLGAAMSRVVAHRDAHAPRDRLVV